MIDRVVTRRAFHAAALAGMVGCGARAQTPKPKLKPERTLGAGASLGGKRLMPDDSPWNQDISRSPVDPLSDAILKRVGLSKPLHPDFGTVYRGAPNGIPYVVVPGDQPKVPVKFRYQDESDPGPYPIPPNPPIEGGPNGDGDRHILMFDRDNRKLYELFSARLEPGMGWTAGSGAIFDLNTGAQRPAGWTSADAAGLPILPGLTRYEEVVIQQAVRHALRFTVEKSRAAYVAPARHFASRLIDADLPPMGMRVRLKASYNLAKFPPQAKVILAALKTYGMILADNGGDWFLNGAPDYRWDDDELAELKRVKVADFEVIRMGEQVTK